MGVENDINEDKWQVIFLRTEWRYCVLWHRFHSHLQLDRVQMQARGLDKSLWMKTKYSSLIIKK